VRLLDCTHDAVLDVAGGSGVYSAHLLNRYPNLSAMIPSVPRSTSSPRDVSCRPQADGAESARDRRRHVCRSRFRRPLRSISIRMSSTIGDRRRCGCCWISRTGACCLAAG
jgi:hypothetical protein